jgi:lysyl-tRNA synthetase class 2
MERWQEMNAIAHLTASFASRRGRQLLIKDDFKTKDNEDFKLDIQHAIMIKEAESNKDLLNLARKAKDLKLDVVVFIKEMMETTDNRKVVEWMINKDSSQINFLGVLVFGNKKEVESLTKDFKLFK